MLTANRVQQFLNSAREWEALLRREAGLMATQRVHSPRFAMNDSAMRMEFDLPGLSRDEIDIEVDGDRLRVSTQLKGRESENTGKCLTRERSSEDQKFEFQFPFAIVPENAEVTFVDGVLTIAVSKPEEVQPRKLEIQ